MNHAQTEMSSTDQTVSQLWPIYELIITVSNDTYQGSKSNLRLQYNTCNLFLVWQHMSVNTPITF